MDSFSRMVPANEQGSFLSNFLRQPLPPPLFTSGESMISRPNYASFQLAIFFITCCTLCKKISTKESKCRKSTRDSGLTMKRTI